MLRRFLLMTCAVGFLSGCTLAPDACVWLTRPPYTEQDVSVISEGFARWTLALDEKVEAQCPR